MYRKSTRIAVCIMVAMFLVLSLSLLPRPARAGAEAQFKAVVSSSAITVGETTVVTFSGGQLDVAGGNIIGNFGDEFASVVEVVQVDKNRFKVKGVGPGNAVLKFTDGKNEATVKVRVSAK